MPRPHKIEKTDSELINYQIDFTAVLTAAVGSPAPTIDSVVATAVVKSTEVPAAGIVTGESVSASGKIVYFQLAAGDDDEVYTVTLTMTLSDLQILQECVTLTIKNC